MRRDKRDRFICTKDCSSGNVFLHYYFRVGNIYTIRYMEGSRYYYIEYSVGQDVGVTDEFIKENFKLADNDTILIAELDVLFDVFFEQ